MERPSVGSPSAPPVWRLIYIAQKLIDFAHAAIMRRNEGD
jgi:hypothetical protein